MAGSALSNEKTNDQIISETWQPIGDYAVLKRKKCQHLYAKAGKRKDLALFYDEGKFYAMEAWCSHMDLLTKAIDSVYLHTVKFVQGLTDDDLSMTGRMNTSNQTEIGGPLYLGDIEDYKGKCHVMCPWHSYMFDLETGKNEIGLQQEVYKVKVIMGKVYVNYHSELSLTSFEKQDSG